MPRRKIVTIILLCFFLLFSLAAFYLNSVLNSRDISPDDTEASGDKLVYCIGTCVTLSTEETVVTDLPAVPTKVAIESTPYLPPIQTLIPTTLAFEATRVPMQPTQTPTSAVTLNPTTTQTITNVPVNSSFTPTSLSSTSLVTSTNSSQNITSSPSISSLPNTHFGTSQILLSILFIAIGIILIIIKNRKEERFEKKLIKRKS